jgi:hypothetical protein
MGEGGAQQTKRPLGVRGVGQHARSVDHAAVRCSRLAIRLAEGCEVGSEVAR